jgi:hypothetical protein
MTDTSVSAQEAVGPAWQGLAPEQQQLLLALRGLLGCDLLLHALQRRHLVEYGRWGAGAAARQAGWLAGGACCCVISSV